MELDRVAFAGRFLAVFVRKRQNAIFIGVGTDIFNAVTAEPEAVSTVAVERDFRSAVIRQYGNTFSGCFCFGSRCRLFNRLFRFRDSSRSI